MSSMLCNATPSFPGIECPFYLPFRQGVTAQRHCLRLCGPISHASELHWIQRRSSPFRLRHQKQYVYFMFDVRVYR